MRSFWSGLNGGLLIFSLIAWIGGVMIFASMLKDSMDSRQLVLLLFGCILLVLIIHSFWGMLVEMSKNVIKSGERYDNLKRENEELKEDLEDMSAILRDVSAQLRVLICQSGPQNNSYSVPGQENCSGARNITLNFSEQEMYWSCKSCGTVNSSDDIMCKKCGMSKFSDVFRTVQEVPTGTFKNNEQNIDNANSDETHYAGNNDNNDTRPWKCSRCGNFNPASSVICGSCGKKRSGQR